MDSERHTVMRDTDPISDEAFTALLGFSMFCVPMMLLLGVGMSLDVAGLLAAIAVGVGILLATAAAFWGMNFIGHQRRKTTFEIGSTWVERNGRRIEVIGLHFWPAGFTLVDAGGSLQYATTKLSSADRDRLVYLLTRAVQLKEGQAPEELRRLVKPEALLHGTSTAV